MTTSPLSCSRRPSLLIYLCLWESRHRSARVGDFSRAISDYGPGWTPNWPPSTEASLGGVGVIENCVFVRRTSLKNLRIRFETLAAKKRHSLEYQTARGVTVTTKVSGEARPDFSRLGTAAAGLRVDFSKEGALVLAADGCYETQISDQRGLLKASERKATEWPRKWVVVTHVVDADAATILVGGEAPASNHSRTASSYVIRS